ncbi:hypothetical protein [Sphingomicrobium astaxanthinifaciens]|uniref:hypothetical protein n=1 Tax=Sphingomicrobium astaxanthinifaciens TaxID=1227949 RepID=UPI001FCB5AD4|nr:hypothetical protein [Sphingomicrobium astaxanthinifaciens]MCJ7420401.1 hypothetical protein [Sphingomicrobium astaxanthinifaciens]
MNPKICDPDRQRDVLERILSRCHGAYAPITLRGYRSDIEQFRDWCATHGREWFPASPTTLAASIDAQAPALAIATIKRRVEAIK